MRFILLLSIFFLVLAQQDDPHKGIKGFYINRDNKTIASAYFDKNKCALLTIEVQEAYRRQRIATQLIYRILQFAQTQGCTSITAQPANNSGAQLLTSVGFKVSGQHAIYDIHDEKKSLWPYA